MASSIIYLVLICILYGYAHSTDFAVDQDLSDESMKIDTKLFCPNIVRKKCKDKCEFINVIKNGKLSMIKQCKTKCKICIVDRYFYFFSCKEGKKVCTNYA